MNDLEHRLSQLGGGPDADPHVVARDLLRARRARHERRARRTALGGLAALGVAAAVGVGVGTGRHHDPAGPVAQRTPRVPVNPPTQASTTPPPSTKTPPVMPKDVRLVAYHGTQQPGFSTSYIPQGFVLQGSDDVVLACALPGDDTPIFTFKDKLVVTVETRADHGPLDPHGRPVDVDGHPGVIYETGDGGATLLDYQVGDRVVRIQAWESLGLGDHDLLRFAEGLTVSPHVQTVS